MTVQFAALFDSIVHLPTDQQIAFILRRQLLDAFQDFTSEILEACKYEPAAANIPVTVWFDFNSIVL